MTDAPSPSPACCSNRESDDRLGGIFTSCASPDEYIAATHRRRAATITISYAGIAVFADAQQTLSFLLRKSLKTIANVSSRAYVESGPAGHDGRSLFGQRAAAGAAERLGGGGNLNSAYSAIASVPGAYVPANQNGYNQAVHVRGGDSYEVGYEFDGIPVNSNTQ